MERGRGPDRADREIEDAARLCASYTLHFFQSIEKELYELHGRLGEVQAAHPSIRIDLASLLLPGLTERQEGAAGPGRAEGISAGGGGEASAQSGGGVPKSGGEASARSSGERRSQGPNEAAGRGTQAAVRGGVATRDVAAVATTGRATGGPSSADPLDAPPISAAVPERKPACTPLSPDQPPAATPRAHTAPEPKPGDPQGFAGAPRPEGAAAAPPAQAAAAAPPAHRWPPTASPSHPGGGDAAAKGLAFQLAPPTWRARPERPTEALAPANPGRSAEATRAGLAALLGGSTDPATGTNPAAPQDPSWGALSQDPSWSALKSAAAAGRRAGGSAWPVKPAGPLARSGSGTSLGRASSGASSLSRPGSEGGPHRAGSVGVAVPPAPVPGPSADAPEPPAGRPMHVGPAPATSASAPPALPPAPAALLKRVLKVDVPEGDDEGGGDLASPPGASLQLSSPVALPTPPLVGSARVSSGAGDQASAAGTAAAPATSSGATGVRREAHRGAEAASEAGAVEATRLPGADAPSPAGGDGEPPGSTGEAATSAPPAGLAGAEGGQEATSEAAAKRAPPPRPSPRDPPPVLDPASSLGLGASSAREATSHTSEPSTGDASPPPSPVSASLAASPGSARRAKKARISAVARNVPRASRAPARH